MPCRVDPTPEEIEASRKARESRQTAERQQTEAKAQRRISAAEKAAQKATEAMQTKVDELTDANNALSVRVDYLQDLIWRMENHDEREPFPTAEVHAVLDRQIEHRKADLDRLIRTLTDAEDIDYDRLRKVLDADPYLPLESQLGFDPDSI